MSVKITPELAINLISSEFSLHYNVKRMYTISKNKYVRKGVINCAFQAHCSLRLSHISGSVVSARVVALQWRVSQQVAIASFQQDGSLMMMMRRMTRIMLIPNKEASSGFNVGLPRYQWSPVLVLLFPLPASVCVCVCVSTFQDPKHLSGPSILHECPSSLFLLIKNQQSVGT